MMVSVLAMMMVMAMMINLAMSYLLSLSDLTLFLNFLFYISINVQGVSVEGISPKLVRSHILIKKVPLLLALKQ